METNAPIIQAKKSVARRRLLQEKEEEEYRIGRKRNRFVSRKFEQASRSFAQSTPGNSVEDRMVGSVGWEGSSPEGNDP